MSKDRPTPASKGRDAGVFEPVIARALALSPRDRWKDAGELLAALDDAAAGKPPPPPAASAAPAAMPEAGRRRPGLLAGGLAVLVVVAGVAIGISRASRRTTPAPIVRVAAPAVPSAPLSPPPARAIEPTMAVAPTPAPANVRPRAKVKAKTAAPAPPSREEKPPSAPRDLFDDIR